MGNKRMHNGGLMVPPISQAPRSTLPGKAQIAQGPRITPPSCLPSPGSLWAATSHAHHSQPDFPSPVTQALPPPSASAQLGKWRRGENKDLISAFCTYYHPPGFRDAVLGDGERTMLLGNVTSPPKKKKTL